MSMFSQFAGGGGGIKSIQRGVIVITPGGSTGTATITPVNTAKSELRCLGVSGYTTTANNYTGSNNGMVVLTNSTTITATLGYYQVPSFGSCSVSWELTEWI